MSSAELMEFAAQNHAAVCCHDGVLRVTVRDEVFEAEMQRRG